MDLKYASIMKKAFFALALMFGILFAAATAVLWYLEMPIGYAVAVTVIITLIQYLVSPYIIQIL